MKTFKFFNSQYKHDRQVVRYVNLHMRNGWYWRGCTDVVEEYGRYYPLTIISGIKLGGMYHLCYKILRDGETTHYNLSVHASKLEYPYEKF